MGLFEFNSGFDSFCKDCHVAGKGLYSKNMKYCRECGGLMIRITSFGLKRCCLDGFLKGYKFCTKCGTGLDKDEISEISEPTAHRV